MKETKFTLGIVCLMNALTSFFLVVAYLFKDKKNTAAPFIIVGFVQFVAGMMLISNKIKEKFDEDDIQDAMDDFCDDGRWFPHGSDIPVDDTANEEEFC